MTARLAVRRCNQLRHAFRRSRPTTGIHPKRTSPPMVNSPCTIIRHSQVQAIPTGGLIPSPPTAKHPRSSHFSETTPPNLQNEQPLNGTARTLTVTVCTFGMGEGYQFRILPWHRPRLSVRRITRVGPRRSLRNAESAINRCFVSRAATVSLTRALGRVEIAEVIGGVRDPSLSSSAKALGSAGTWLVFMLSHACRRGDLVQNSTPDPGYRPLASSRLTSGFTTRRPGSTESSRFHTVRHGHQVSGGCVICPVQTALGEPPTENNSTLDPLSVTRFALISAEGVRVVLLGQLERPMLGLCLQQ
jgi:hypothetical protein